ncbi:unnamed protein product [Hymenolepis diminuta]|uniref:Uncharacterized protein n=1 Tax=Hymenolepis diminuta TaxID=6216 RepID=A0A564Z8H6_HYMDI|nr:unnamed protein product [Hymenolepis diminuta]
MLPLILPVLAKKEEDLWVVKMANYQLPKMPSYGYPPGPPQTLSQSMPPQSQQPQFSMPPGGGGGEYGPPRYDNVAPPQPPSIGSSGMPPNVGIDSNAGGMLLTGPHQAPPQAIVSGASQSQQSIQSSGTSGGPTQPDSGVIQQQQSQAPSQTPSGLVTAEPSPKPQMTGSADQSLQQQTTHSSEEQPPSSTSSNLS